MVICGWERVLMIWIETMSFSPVPLLLHYCLKFASVSKILAGLYACACSTDMYSYCRGTGEAKNGARQGV